MTARTVIVCDICGAEAATGERWFEAGEDGDHSLLLSTFTGMDSLSGTEHLCSSACLIKRVHQFEHDAVMEKGN